MSLPAIAALKARAKLRKDKARAKAKRLKLRQSPKALKHKADRLFSLAVRSVGHCESGRTGCKGPLQCAHHFSRRYLAVRWDRRNASCLCAAHHLYWTHRPIEWDQWIRGRMCDDYYTVRDLALAGMVDIDDVLARLTRETN